MTQIQPDMSDSVKMLDFEAFKAKYQKVPVEEYPNNVIETVPEPVVSVQISTYQHVDFIRDCLEGVLMQETDFPVEILIGEDESDDGTREICKEYADRYPDKIRLLLHRRENNIKVHGRPTPNFQWNYTRFLCRGKYIAVCEGDDYWTDPMKLQKQVDFLEANPGYVLSLHASKVINSMGEVVREPSGFDPKRADLSRFQLMKGPSFTTVTLCFENKIRHYPAEFFESMNQDNFLTSILGQHGKGKYIKGIKPSVYRLHKGGMWSSLSKIKQAQNLSSSNMNAMLYYENTNYKEIYEDFRKRANVSKYRYHLLEKEYFESLKYLIGSFNIIIKKEGLLKAIAFMKHSVTMFVGSLKLSKNE